MRFLLCHVWSTAVRSPFGPLRFDPRSVHCGSIPVRSTAVRSPFGPLRFDPRSVHCGSIPVRSTAVRSPFGPLRFDPRSVHCGSIPVRSTAVRSPFGPLRFDPHLLSHLCRLCYGRDANRVAASRFRWTTGPWSTAGRFGLRPSAATARSLGWRCGASRPCGRWPGTRATRPVWSTTTTCPCAVRVRDPAARRLRAAPGGVRPGGVARPARAQGAWPPDTRRGVDLGAVASGRQADIYDCRFEQRLIESAALVASASTTDDESARMPAVVSALRSCRQVFLSVYREACWSPNLVRRGSRLRLGRDRSRWCMAAGESTSFRGTSPQGSCASRRICALVPRC